jgi:putative oxidoreductase
MMATRKGGVLNAWLDNTTRHGPGSLALLILRLGAGGMLIFGHGWDKLAHFSEKTAMFPDPVGLGSAASLALATFAEFFCALAIVLGLATRVAAIPLVINMLVAALIFHAGDPWPKKELALLYATPFITLLLAGGGKYSLDALIWPRVLGGGRR